MKSAGEDRLHFCASPCGTGTVRKWDYGDGMDMLRVFWDEAVALDPSVDARDERHRPFSREGELGRFWRDHGLTDLQEAPLVVDLEFASFDDFWRPFLGRQGPAVKGLVPPKQQTDR